MEQMLELKDRFKKFLDHYSLSPDTLSKKIGGSRGTYFAIQSGKSKPDFNTSENILMNFPEISAEWWFRGTGSMLRSDTLSVEEAEMLKAENKAIKAMYRAELVGKDEDDAKRSGFKNEKPAIVKGRFYLSPSIIQGRHNARF